MLTNHQPHTYSEDLTNPVAAIPPIDAGLIKLFDDIRTTVDQEAEIISMVFPNPAAVFQVFIQRVFEQSVGASFIFTFTLMPYDIPHSILILLSLLLELVQ